MLETNSPNHVFRFLQVRPPLAIDTSKCVLLLGDTAIAKTLSALTPSKRRAKARGLLPSTTHAVRDILETELSRALAAAIENILRAEGTVLDLQTAAESFDTQSHTRSGTGRGSKAATANAEVLSDYLFVAKFAGIGTARQLRNVVETYHGYVALTTTDDNFLDKKLADFLSLPIVLPTIADAGPTASGKRRRSSESDGSRADGKLVERPFDWPERLVRTRNDLVALFRSEFAERSANISKTARGARSEPKEPRPFTLRASAAARLSADGREVLQTLGIDPTVQPIHAIAAVIETEIAAAGARLATLRAYRPPPRPGPRPQGEEGLPVPQTPVRAAGIAELLVVKQHLKKYQRTDIAHVENILAGEDKTRVHRSLERTEQTFITEREVTEERETELETAERFELNQETEKTITRDQEIGFGLTLSGKYGPAVEFSSDFEADISSSTEETVRSAVTYAKDVMERSLERVTARVREEQIRRIIREEEETNTHTLKNESPTHVVGVYQFLEKVYESQVFNYGIRQLFDFMVPEPASYIWYLEDTPGTELSLPAPPPKLETYAGNAQFVNEANYPSLAALVGANGIEPPPPILKISTAAIKHGESGDEEGQPRSVMDKDVSIPAGYAPLFATAHPMALTDDELTLGITVGIDTVLWQPRGPNVVAVDEATLSRAPRGVAEAMLPFLLTGSNESHDEQSKLMFHVLAYETNAYSVALQVMFMRTKEAYSAWQIKTYDALVAANREQQLKYDQVVADLRARAENAAARATSRFGSPPSQNLKTIKSELKKHCISILTQQWYDAFNAVNAADPPEFDLAAAAEEGSFIRFFEQAFEWDQLQYVCYPYFWSWKETWSDRFRREDVDPVFLEFLQSGAARVVVPVRPGFEKAVVFFLENGEIWNGSGSPPPINSPLYVSIVEEIRSRTGASQGEIPVGEPWTTIVPTPLVILRQETPLPQWTRQDPEGWDWDEA